MQIIDTKGKLCPAPLILTKRAIKNAVVGEKFVVESDNETAKNNLLKYLSELGFEPVCEVKNGFFEITFEVVKSSAVESVSSSNIGDYCSSNGYSVVIKSRRMGEGDEKLGTILMRAFVNSLIDSDLKPANIVIYNEGVFVALKGEDTAEALVKLSENGVAITVCGTCVDFYGVKDKLAVGEISNMYKITEILSQSSSVVYP